MMEFRSTFKGKLTILFVYNTFLTIENLNKLYDKCF